MVGGKRRRGSRAEHKLDPRSALAAVGAGPMPGTEHQQSPRGAAGTSSSGKGGSRDEGSSAGPAGGEPSMDPHGLDPTSPRGAEWWRRAQG